MPKGWGPSSYRMGGGWSRCAGGVAVEGEPPSDGEELDIAQEDETQPLKPAKKAGGEAQSKRWQRGQLLGEGSFGRVLMALDEHSGELQAVKEIPLGPASSPQAEQAASQLQEELRLLQQLRHQNVVDYAGYQRLDHCLCIFLRYVSGGSVASLLSSFGPFPERVLRNYSAQLAPGLEFLHHHGVVHRDIKGSNALVTTSGVVKLADFGASKSLDQLVSATSGFKSFRGTPHLMAPGSLHLLSVFSLSICSSSGLLNIAFFICGVLQRLSARKAQEDPPMSGALVAS